MKPQSPVLGEGTSASRVEDKTRMCMQGLVMRGLGLSDAGRQLVLPMKRKSGMAQEMNCGRHGIDIDCDDEI